MQNSSIIKKLADKAGIRYHYLNGEGKTVEIALSTLQQLLTTMNICIDVPDEEQRPFPPVQVFRTHEHYQIPIHHDFNKLTYSLETETGKHLHINVNTHGIIELPADLSLGYHWLTTSENDRQWQCRIIIAPDKGYEPDGLKQNQPLWGTTIQLYTLRAQKNWGIGDFSDLKEFIRFSAREGAAFVGINPVHALYPADPESCSPYSPSSRLWFNPIYIDVESVAAFIQSPDAQQWLHSEEIQQEINRLRVIDQIDYSAVYTLKLTALRIAFEHFLNDGINPDFCTFKKQGGENLADFALFHTLQAHFNGHQWPMWPAPFHNPAHQKTHSFREQNHKDIEFHSWMQWLADEQWQQCHKLCQDLNMPVGLYRDLAIGTPKWSAEIWQNQTMFTTTATIGAPPDRLGPSGQNWQLSPLNPSRLKASAYQPFIDLLRANMRYCGALRLDHIIGLSQLWWIPESEDATNGAYVQYPLNDLLAILILESQRHHCLVIGETLGTIPSGLIEQLQTYSIYTYKVAYFEQEDHQLKAPEHYDFKCLTTITTHDLPTLTGYWQETDLTIGNMLGLYRDPSVLIRLKTERHADKEAMLNGLYQCHFLTDTDRSAIRQNGINPLLIQAFHRYLAASNSLLTGFQPEDWLDIATPVNIPGTDKNYPNWRRKLTCTTQEMAQNPVVLNLLAQIREARPDYRKKPPE